ncbi:hypothetical protein FA15DRAFT_711895 [Coprinopsis marcescibilis]|uniref:Uncharacterized protein n=1 Tax=Coprinopsis marcescibilis TaxID=230819 RepID=A0A5C3K921_COPMA|nr:hypothetical protein FA15DRAFT_711895 [Coprinopsis marcescibilis]
MNGKEAHTDNIISGGDKQDNELDRVVVVWANTERYGDIIPGLDNTTDNLLNAIKIHMTKSLLSPSLPSSRASPS